mmetsp:Transcript_19277/g.37126  ORF Transcript_19277/g.37126 Transcript_19277/m.37126 type:complete len:272 (+) Transcript_19277:248-1063(+)
MRNGDEMQLQATELLLPPVSVLPCVKQAGVAKAPSPRISARESFCGVTWPSGALRRTPVVRGGVTSRCIQKKSGDAKACGDECCAADGGEGGGGGFHGKQSRSAKANTCGDCKFSCSMLGGVVSCSGGPNTIALEVASVSASKLIRVVLGFLATSRKLSRERASVVGDSSVSGTDGKTWTDSRKSSCELVPGQSTSISMQPGPSGGTKETKSDKRPSWIKAVRFAWPKAVSLSSILNFWRNDFLSEDTFMAPPLAVKSSIINFRRLFHVDT